MKKLFFPFASMVLMLLAESCREDEPARIPLSSEEFDSLTEIVSGTWDFDQIFLQFKSGGYTSFSGLENPDCDNFNVGVLPSEVTFQPDANSNTLTVNRKDFCSNSLVTSKWEVFRGPGTSYVVEETFKGKVYKAEFSIIEGDKTENILVINYDEDLEKLQQGLIHLQLIMVK